MTQDEIEMLTLLLRDHYPCGLIGCRQTGETFAALVAEVRRLRALVREAFNEGFAIGWDDPGNRDYWPESWSRKTLEGE